MPWIIRTIVGCLLLQMVISHLLWWSVERSFPMLPALPFIPVLNNVAFGFVLPSVFAILLLGVFILPNSKKVIYTALLLASLLALFDVNRLQVWTYQWLCMLTVAAFVNNLKHKVHLFQFLIIALYIWSGLNKLNVYYIDHSFPYLMDAFTWTKGLGQNSLFALLTGLLEVAIGIGLALPKIVKLATGFAVFLHLIILLILGPLGLGENEVIWPWNIAMIVLVILLFKSLPFNGITTLWNSNSLAKIMMVLWAFMPLLNTVDLWDEALSFKMYSGTNPEGILFSEAIDSDCLPQSIKVYYTRSGNQVEEERIMIDDWALMEMKTPPYVSERTLKQIGRKWCSCLENRNGSGLEILRVKRWSREELPFLRFTCAELMSFQN